ncbi:MAG: hypothetical protein ACE3L7_07215 [Candidatus Pristimantibacillus sp.]
MKAKADTDISSPKYTKEQLLGSQRHAHQKDILAAVLKDKEMYTHEQAEKLVSTFLNKEVK